MNETATYEIIGHDAELACFKIYHGDYPERVRELAKERVIKSNLRFVLKFAIDYHKITGLPIADFMAEGKLGLMEAFYKFDHTAGVKFGSYAIWYVRTCMSRIVNEQHDLIRVPVRLRKKVLNMLRSGTDTGSVKYGKLAENVIVGMQSIDQPCQAPGDDDGEILGNFITYEEEVLPSDECAGRMVSERLMQALDSDLTQEERFVIKSSFGIDIEESSLNTVADDIGSSKEWARRIKSRALSKLRDSRGLSRLKDMV